MNNNELKHYGVLGMKWGIRRYQNEDGTLTPAGRRRTKKTNKILKKYVKKAGKNADYYNEEADDLKKDVTQLKIVGTRSKLYRNYLKEQEDNKEYDDTVDSDYALLDELDKQRTNSGVVGKISAKVVSNKIEKKIIEKLYRENEYRIDELRDAASDWMRTQKKLMELNVDDLLAENKFSKRKAKREIRRVYNS